MINFKEEFKRELGDPKCDISEYLDFILKNSKIVETGYTEKHHILPRSKFPQFAKTEENVFTLCYEDHMKAHILLAESYPIQEFITPLGFLKGIIKGTGYSEILSIRAKNGWVKLKESEKYSEYIETQREGNKKWNFKGNPSHERVRKAHEEKWKNISETDRKKFSSKMKSISEDPENKKRHISSIHKFAKTDEFRILQRELVQGRWDDKTQEEREEFRNKMNSINSDENKRRDASEKIKKKWDDPLWREKNVKKKV